MSGDERSEEVVSAMPSAEREKCGAFFSRLRHNLLCSFYLEQIFIHTRVIKNENILKKYFSFCRHEVELFFDEKVRIEVSFIP